MRVLLLHHGPLAGSPQGALAAGWAAALQAAGHDVRILLVSDRREPNASPAQRTIVCRAAGAAADLAFGVPSFESQLESPPQGQHEMVGFASLADDQLQAYRDQLRRHLDAEVDQFDPQVLHAQHLWIWAQLALETGVPYVASAWETELAQYDRDPRYGRWVEQAAENAARIVACDEALAGQLIRRFELSRERLLTMTPQMLACEGPQVTGDHRVAVRQWADIYQAVLEERFGPAA